ncbi:MAG: DUF5663 domain-containing protein [bacterium]|nr:DUF5663 domain-containing protein [bacterium]
MNNTELREILIKELGIEGLPEEAQDEIVGKLGEIILKSLTVAIFDKLSGEAREEFERISEAGDSDLIQEFLEKSVPDLHLLMEEEVKKTLNNFADKGASGEERPKERGEI